LGCFTGQATHADPNGAKVPGMLEQRILNKNTIGVCVLVCNNYYKALCTTDTHPCTATRTGKASH